MKPKLDGSHDNLPDLHTKASPRTEALMRDRLRPLMEAMVEEEGTDGLEAWLVEMAEELEPHLRVHDPDNRLLAFLDEHRRGAQGFC